MPYRPPIPHGKTPIPKQWFQSHSFVERSFLTESELRFRVFLGDEMTPLFGVKRRFGLAAVMCATLWTTHSEAIVVPLDNFSVTRNGADFFTDNFSDGLEPPSGPTSPTNYGVNGVIPGTAEAGGQLLLDSSLGILTANATDDARIFLGVTLLSDNTTNLSLGLKSDDTLILTGTFGLTVPVGPLISAYGIRFSDGGNQIAQLAVQYQPSTAQAEIRYLLQDFVANTITVLGSVALAAPNGSDQILLRLSRPNVANDDLFASFTYLSGGVAVGNGTFNQAAQIFQGEEWVRAQFFASEAIAVAAIPEPETYALMLSGLAFLASRRIARRR